MSIIWLSAAMLILIYKIVKYIIFLKIIHNGSAECCDLPGIPKGLTVRKTKFSEAPLIIGLIKPILYIPDSEISTENLDYILLHEVTHCKRGDLAYKWFTMLVCSVHWFNPFVYFISNEIDKECETSCDYEAVKNLTETQRKNYMNMILDLASNSVMNSKQLTTRMISDKKTLKRRFTMIKNLRKTNKLMSVISVFTAIILFGTTVFASGVLFDRVTDDYKIEIINNEERIEFINTENGEVIAVSSNPVSVKSENKFILPNGIISADYNERHSGIDYAGNKGDPVYSAANGTVCFAGYDTSKGNFVIISHKEGYQTCYAHLSKIDVNINDNVDVGEKIGEIGSTGMSTGPHLHFEIRLNGIAVNPYEALMK